MRIFVEGGSTKSDWAIVDHQDNRTFLNTMGFNPYFHDEALIASEIRKQDQLLACAAEVQELFFYGAGCSTPELNAIVQKGLASVFVNAAITVGHDLEACAYATYQGEPCISCVIGTGSNSCYFDGKQIYEEVPALAYILGDEGSGSYYGKQLLSKFLYKQLPAHIHKDFYEQYKLDKDTIITNVYLKPHANSYIASFMRFFSRHKEDPFVIEMITEGMTRFLTTHVLCYDCVKEVKVHFVGSIAYHFADILRSVGADLGIEIGNITQKPINSLVDYHLKYICKKTQTQP